MPKSYLQLKITPPRRGLKKVVVGEKEKSGPLELINAGPLTHPALLQYLTKRRIDHKVASKYVSQIDFKGSQGRGTYFGVGFPLWKWLRGP